MCEGVNQAVDGYKMAGNTVEGDMLVKREEVIKSFLSEFRHREAEHGEEHEHAGEVETLTWEQL